MHFKDEMSVRKSVEQDVGCSIPYRLWGFLVEQGWVLDVTNAPDDAERKETYDYLVYMTRSMMKLIYNIVTDEDYVLSLSAVKGLKVSSDLQVDSPKNMAVIGTLVGSLMAEALAGRVEEFRKRWLNGRVLTPNEVGDWLDEQDRAPFETKEGEGGSQELLWWNGRAYSVEMTHCALCRKRKQPLYELYDLVKDISQRFLCGEERALLYILCNQIPPVGVMVRRCWTLHLGVPRISLEIPVWVTEEEVVSLYRQARRGWVLAKRFRPPSQRLVRAVRELVEAKLNGESLTAAAKRLGMSRNMLADMYYRARKTAEKVLKLALQTNAKEGKDSHDNES